MTTLSFDFDFRPIETTATTEAELVEWFNWRFAEIDGDSRNFVLYRTRHGGYAVAECRMRETEEGEFEPDYTGLEWLGINAGTALATR